MPIVVVCSWVFNDILVPRFFIRKRYGKFILYTVYLMIISLNLEFVLIFVSFILLGYFDHDHLLEIIDSYKWMPLLMYLIVLLYGFLSVMMELLRQQDLSAGNHVDEFIQVRSERKNRRIDLSDILYIESMADYIRIITEEQEKIITREKISSITSRLPESFLRIHRSFIINVAKIESFTREEIIIQGMELPISRTYKKEVNRFLSQRLS